MKKMSRVTRVFALGLLGLACLIPLEAQDASITGSVLDQAGKVIPKAAVVVKSDTAPISKGATTDAEGHFVVTGLPAGTYSVQASAAGFSTATASGIMASTTPSDISITLAVGTASDSVTVEAVVSLAAQSAPSGNTLDATSARTEITGDFIKNFESPLADFGEYVALAPGTFTVNTNGTGLGQASTYFRGFQDGQYTMTFDGIPFEDTNTPTHHSWSNFPAPWIGGVDFDRSPGQASNFGPTNFGGAINLLSKEVPSTQDIRATGSYGSFNTRLLELDYDSGAFGPGDKNNSLSIDLHQMLSDGYQTFNRQKRVAGNGKYIYRLSPRTHITLFAGLVDLWANTPKFNGPTRAQVAQFGDNFLLSGDQFLSPGVYNPYYYGFDFYHVQTDFEYIAFDSDLGDGWKFEDKAYTTRYWNKQNYQNGATINLTAASPSGVDKLNGYRHAGDTAILSKESKWGVFRAGAWYDWAYTDRYQIPSNIITWVDTPFGNFHEHYTTQSFQPFAEYEWRATSKLVVTAGIKAANYAMRLNQYQDVKTVGCLGGTLVKANTSTNTPAMCVGGGAFTTHSIDWNNWLPTLTARYRVQRNWSVYGQFAEGSIIPPSGNFDVTGGNVLTSQKPTLAKTYQAGSVLKFNRWTLDMDAYYIHFENGYASYLDPDTAEPVYVPTGPTNTKGVEAESNIFLGYGLSLYLNASFGSAKYQEGVNYPNGGLWVANTPRDIEGFALLWQRKNWDVGFVNKRVGSMYNDNGTLSYLINGQSISYPVNEAISIDPFDLTNIYVNYTIKSQSFLRGTKIGVAVNNLFDSHNIVGIPTAGNAPTLAVPYTPSPNDTLTLLPGRSVMISLTVGYAPRR